MNVLSRTILPISFSLGTLLSMGQAPGSVDLGFNPDDAGFYRGDGIGGEVLAIVPLANGKALIGQSSQAYNNQGSSRLLRINEDGLRDETFTGGANGAVRSIAVQADGKAVIGGSFTQYLSVTRTRVARVNTDGSLDTSFDPGAGANDVVHAVALQSDGKVLVGGNFTTLGGQPRARIARLNTDGSLDNSFDTGTGALGGEVRCVVVQPDGRILIAGNFTTYNGVSAVRFTRLMPDGSIDPSLNNVPLLNDRVHAIALGPDNKIHLAGEFYESDGLGLQRVFRLHPDGSRDLSFSHAALGNSHHPKALEVDQNGSVTMGGSMTVSFEPHSTGIVRFTASGAIDPSFQPGSGASYMINVLARRPDGRYLVGGSFDTFNDQSGKRLVQLNGNGWFDPYFNAQTGAMGTVECVRTLPGGALLFGWLVPGLQWRALQWPGHGGRHRPIHGP